MSKPIPQHPGPYIRENVLPKGVSVSKAARTLGTSRPTLSNLLNGNSALSPEMAAKIVRAFGANGQELLDMQAAFDAWCARETGAAAAAKAHVPPFLQLKANDIEAWANTHAARHRLAVFIRTLVHSTGLKIQKAEFHGNDDAERPGWDGFVEADEGTPWVPAGTSGWEFGVNSDPKRKADGDYAKSLLQVGASERAETTFVFVTPRRWQGKTAWEKEKRAEGQWKNVRVFDASNLEEWLEQSIPAQAWLARELNVPSEGVLSLDECWRQWAADCEPAPVEALFEDAVQGVRRAAIDRVSGEPGNPLVILADSTSEALAFLHCLFSASDPELTAYRDRLVVFTAPGPLAKLASRSSQFIAVVANKDVERDLAQHKKHLASIVVYPRNTTNSDPDIVLEPLRNSAFDKALQAMGCSRDDVSRLSRESGRSLTVLRRRLSKLEAIRSPAWAADRATARSLVPILFAGSWNSRSEADKIIMSLLARDMKYDELEKQLTALVQLEDAPVWSLGTFRGLVSKIDVLFAISKDLTKEDLDLFLNVAKLVLSEDDPSLDLPEEERWAAAIHKKTREISAALRDGICETVVLLSVHGNTLLRDRLGLDVEAEIAGLILGLLTPLTTRTLEAQSDDLPMYAEAAPKEFLAILERDLEMENPESIGLMRPAKSGIFGGGCPRTGLLWALENLAWSPDHLPRTVLVLGRLAQPVIDDNWVNRPGGSLGAIFRCWMPQTAAPLDSRIAALELLARRFPKTAWEICVAQFNGHSTVGHYSHKPRWRKDGHGFGEPVTRLEAHKFAVHALEMALSWPSHDRQTIGDLVSCAIRLDERYQERIWNLVTEWSKTASEEDRTWMREKIRVSTFTRRARRGEDTSLSPKMRQRARDAYDALLPSDLVARHGWLFKKQWVEESADELEEEDVDFHKREERIANLRMAALREIIAERGVPGIIQIAEAGEAAGVVGWNLPNLAAGEELLQALRFVIEHGPLAESPPRRSILFGALGALSQDGLQAILPSLIAGFDDDTVNTILVHCPFGSATWDFVRTLGSGAERRYWQNANIGWPRNSAEELQFAIDRLLEVDRPRAAFHVIHFQVEEVQPKQLYRLMSAVASGGSDAAGTYQLDNYDIRRAFEVLQKSGEISTHDMAALEFKYLDVFMYEGGGIPNLNAYMETHPELFVQAVVYAYKRSDSREDPEEFRAVNEESREARMQGAHKLLDKLSRVPGRDANGDLSAVEMEKWVQQVRSACKDLAREEIGDFCIGKLLSHAPEDKDGIWPCKPVREVMERTMTEAMQDGITNALYNARGMVARGEGGDQERDLASKYRKWAQAHEYTHPRVTKMLMEMVGTYENEAGWHDTESGIRRRMGH